MSATPRTGEAGRARRIFRRGPWENASTIVIGLGVFSLMQPFSLTLFSWSFAVILIGTIAFVVTTFSRWGIGGSRPRQGGGAGGGEQGSAGERHHVSFSVWR